MIDLSFKHRFQLVSEGLVGPLNRQGNPDGFHPMLRQNWSIEDALRGALAYYWTVYQSSKGDTLWSYPFPGMNATDHSSQNLGKLHLQVNNIVLEIDNLQEILALPRADQMSPSLLIGVPELGNRWNDYEEAVNAALNWLTLDPQAPGNLTLHPGQVVARFRQHLLQYLMSSGFTIDNKEYQGLVTATPSIIEDYYFRSYAIPGNKPQREAIGTTLGVETEYYRYIDTVPNYESVIASSQVPESYLPNLYIMDAEAKNDSPTFYLLADWHRTALTLDGAIPYFKEIGRNMGRFTEDTAINVYDTWATTLAGQANVVTPERDTAMANNNTTFAVVSSDQRILDDGAVSPLLAPFVSKIIIPRDPQESTGMNEAASFFESLAADPVASDFLDMLQILCINSLENYNPQATSAGDYRVTTKAVLSAEDASDFSFTTDQKSYSYLANVGAALEEYLEATALSPAARMATALFKAGRVLSDYLDPATTLVAAPAPQGEPSYRLLRDYARCIDAEGNGYAPPPLYKIPLRGDAPQAAATILQEDTALYFRTFLECLGTLPAHTETLMYVVDKHEITAEGNDGPRLQRFYLTNRFNSPGGITFYDSQVKYDKRYRYKIQKMVAIFGSAYSYNGTAVQNANALPVDVSNNGNIKVVLMPHVFGPTPQESGLDCIVMDYPPVPPEMSFYGRMGVNNKLQILLNSNTGRYDQPPIAIEDSDVAFFEAEYLAQNQVELTYDEIKEQKKTLEFVNDDPIDRYQLFRTTVPPANYESFKGRQVQSSGLDPIYGSDGSVVDTVAPNTTYYYCARSVDVHGNISNPTPIIEVELVDNDGQIFLRQKPYVFKTVKEPLTISGRRYILIEPSSRQAEFQTEGQPVEVTLDSTPTVPLGEPDLEDRVWNKVFKVRLTSKKTGRKIDFNINFKNSGIVKGSE